MGGEGETECGRERWMKGRERKGEGVKEIKRKMAEGKRGGWKEEWKKHRRKY